jgi:hypothetical protein
MARSRKIPTLEVAKLPKFPSPTSKRIAAKKHKKHRETVTVVEGG